MTLKEQVKEDLERLDEGGLREVADFVAFLQFRTRRHVIPEGDEARVAALYAEFAEEDLVLAEAGMADYAAGLAREDAAVGLREPEIVYIDLGYEDVPRYSPVCSFCVHLGEREVRHCAAFPHGISLTIWQGENNHRQPYPGDHGVQFEEWKEAAAEAAEAALVKA